ncbi:MAG: FtsX-like permease family protein [Bacillota bacterium]
MRTSNLAYLAWKNLKGSWAVLPTIGFAIAAFCLCFAGAILTVVQEEKAQSYEVIVAAQESKSLTDNDIAEMTKLEDVTAVTGILEVPAIVISGDYTAKLTLTGMGSQYIGGDYAAGSAYPADTVMPYIVLNEAARKAFSAKSVSGSDNSGDTTASAAPDIDWLNVSFTVQLGEELRPVTAKVCGLLTSSNEEDEEPAAYISLSSAKALLEQGGQSTSYASLRVRVTNIGSAESVSKGISALGLSVSNSTEELQTGWDADTKEFTYLLANGIFGLTCASFLLAAWRALSLSRQKHEFEALRYLGMKEHDIRRLFAVQTGMLALIGITFGVLTALVLPSFLSTGEAMDTNYLLPIPFNVILGCVAVCAAAGMIPVLGRRRQGGK